jgi:hypothetical protein
MPVMLAVLVSVTLVHTAAAQRAQPRPQRVDPLTASIRGRVTTADTGAPIRGAEVRLSKDGSYSRLVTTNGDGRFELRDLPAAKYQLSVSRAGFIGVQHGQRRPFELPAVIDLAEGQSATANLTMRRGGAVFGRVLDQFGEPAAGIRVNVLRSRMVQGSRRLERVGPGDQTDDTGAYRVYALPPGDYFVAASGGPVDSVKRDPPIYYPGTPSFAEAQPVTLDAGGEASADFQLTAVRGATVSGSVLDSAGRPVAAMVNLRSEVVAIGPNTGPGAAGLDLHADATPDGTFTVENVPPGPYMVVAMLPFTVGGDLPAGLLNPAERIPESVAMALVITGEDVAGLSLVTRPPGRLEGTFVADAAVTRPLPQGLRASLRAANGTGMTMTTGGLYGKGFRLTGVSGPSRIEVEGVPDDWTVKAILVDGEDVTDDVIDLKSDPATLRIVMTDRLTAVSGTMQSGSPPPDGEGPGVVVFPDDAAKWRWPSRHVRTTRADAEGRFEIRGLPPDQRYLAVAVDYLEDGDEQDPQFLERLRGRATSFTLGEGERRAIQVEAQTR